MKPMLIIVMAGLILWIVISGVITLLAMTATIFSRMMKPTVHMMITAFAVGAWKISDTRKGMVSMFGMMTTTIRKMKISVSTIPRLTV